MFPIWLSSLYLSLGIEFHLLIWQSWFMACFNKLRPVDNWWWRRWISWISARHFSNKRHTFEEYYLILVYNVIVENRIALQRWSSATMHEQRTWEYMCLLRLNYVYFGDVAGDMCVIFKRLYSGQYSWRNVDYKNKYIVLELSVVMKEP